MPYNDIVFEIQKSEEVPSQEGESQPGTWVVEGLATTSDFDLQGDLVSNEAITASVDDLKKRSTLLFNHQENRPIGRILEVEVRQEGLWIKAAISKEAEKIWNWIQEGVLSKFSIRAKIVKAVDEFVPSLRRMARVIKRMVILEASIVSVPANDAARTLNSYVQKQAEIELAIQQLQAKFEQGGQNMAGEKTDVLEELFDTASEALKAGGDVEPPDPTQQPPAPPPQPTGLTKDESDAIYAEIGKALENLQALIGQLQGGEKAPDPECDPEDYPTPPPKAAGEPEPGVSKALPPEVVKQLSDYREMESTVGELVNVLGPMLKSDS